MAKLDDKELVSQLLENLRLYGDIRHCTIGLNIHYSTVHRACNIKSKFYRPEFAQQVKDALAEYAACNIPPHEQAYLRKGVLEQYKQIVESGEHQTEEIEYYGEPEEYAGKPHKKRKKGLPKWVYEKAFPPPNPTQEGLHYYSTEQLNDMLASNDFSPQEKEKHLLWLREWTKQKAIDLQLVGKPTDLMSGLMDDDETTE